MNSLPSPQPARYNRAMRWTLGVGVGVMVALGLVLIFLLTLATGNRELYERNYTLLLGLNIAVAAVLLAAIGWIVVRLFLRLRQRKFGSRLLLKLAAGFPTDQRPLLARAMLQQEQDDIKGAQESLALARARKPGPSDPRLDQVAAAWGLAPLRAPSPSRPAKPLQAATGNQNP